MCGGGQAGESGVWFGQGVRGTAVESVMDRRVNESEVRCGAMNRLVRDDSCVGQDMILFSSWVRTVGYSVRCGSNT